MEELLDRIGEYQKAMGYDFKSMNMHARMQAFRNYMVALQLEQAELAQELPIKPWRDLREQIYSSQRVLAEEWVDCLFFLVDQALVLKLTKEEVRLAFELKLAKNFARISSGYNKRENVQGEDA